MILFALALLQSAPASEPVTDEDIVVIGHRLTSWRGQLSTTIGITSCKTTTSTGDRAIDNIGCSALRQCWSDFQPQVVSARKLQGTAKTNEVHRVEAAIGQCITSTRNQLAAGLIAHRRHEPS